VAGDGGTPLDPGAATPEQLTINGVTIFDSIISISANDASGSLREAINAKTSQTSIVASLSASFELVLTGADGRNIDISTTGNIGDELGLEAANGNHNSTSGGQITVTSLENIVVTGTAPAKAGLTVTTILEDGATAVNNLNVVTVARANLAIDIVDKALEEINAIRAGLGAVTNRLELTIQNLEAISENLTASRSRIRDADFAVETANLTRNQILQQAGIAILAQANQTNQSALQLLQG